MRRTASPLVIAIWLALSISAFGDETTALEVRLAREEPAKLAEEARRSGDPTRGALVFFRPSLQCAKCHAADLKENAPPLGPDLARIGRPKSDAHVVESILNPSKEIRQEFEPVTIATRDGKTLIGLLVEDRPDALLVRDPAHDGAIITIPRKEIDEKKIGGPSLMPAGLVNQLADRRDFLDLVRYVLDITEQGPARALALRPPESAFAVPPLPEYERHVDHAGMIAGLGPANAQRGAAIYDRVCVNCHGTLDKPGSLPTSLRFASGAFKNGGDPFHMYQTLTHGFGQMVPQSWMVPEQKYDVIHFIREAYLKPRNPSQYVPVSESYLAGLPRGDTRGPKPSAVEPWVTMDYGPSLALTVEVGDDDSNFAYKGVAVRLDAGPGGVSRGRAWAVFEHDTLRLAAGWTGNGFIDWNGINFNGVHQVHPRVSGLVRCALPDGPAWADPATGRFDDPRLVGRDGRHYGPLPRARGHLLGYYRNGDRVVFAYTVGSTHVLDSPGLERDPSAQGADAGVVFTRALEVGSSEHALALRVALSSTPARAVGAVARLSDENGFQILTIPRSTITRRVKLLLGDASSAVNACARLAPSPTDLQPLTRGGPAHWPDRLTTRAARGNDDGPFAIDVLTPPDANPWNCRMRFSGLDFFKDGDALAACTWDGDVWRVDGLNDPAGNLTWKRFACGLFQPLGLKIVDGVVHVSCRDQIVALHDRNGDGEADFYENVNSDHQVTEHFHEFAMDLQTDAAGNFYYAKAARHGKTALVPQHGTLLKVARDGSKTEILATGFRAPNGVCLNSDGTFFSTDQEGFWLPKNRINYVVRGGFYGNMWGYHYVTDSSDTAMEPPVCWITNEMDRSPAEPVWVTSNAWGPLQGALLNLSYGMGKVFIVPHEMVAGTIQGGVCELPGRVVSDRRDARAISSG